MNSIAWQPVCAPVFPSFDALMAAADAAAPSPAAAPSLAFDPPRAEPPASMRVSVLPTGHIESTASKAFEGGSRAELRRFGLFALLVQHPRGDLLVDAGAGAQTPAHRQLLPWLMRQVSTFVPGTPARRQLIDGGYDPGNLAAIVLTHAHWDHVSGADDFASTPVWAHADEIGFMATGHRAMRVAREIDRQRYRPLAFVDGPYAGFDSSCDVWGDGAVVLVPAPGHTPGSLIVFIALPDGQRLALLGDIVWQMEGIEREVPRPWLSRLVADHAPEQVRRLIAQLARLRRQWPDVLMLPAHDERPIARLPRWRAPT